MMYKLLNGSLVTPPIVWNGIMNYDKDEKRLVADGWKPLQITGEGDIIKYIEHSKFIEEQHSKPLYDYKELRRNAYPEVGDMIDAICKAYQGDDTELQTLIKQREVVKATIRKTQDAD
ncbi:MAG: hypothetical protein J6S67_14030 [Methanobrevibacter sp.]|nr:hypothetical protein [Methanobrevibacter sp.]